MTRNSVKYKVLLKYNIAAIYGKIISQTPLFLFSYSITSYVFIYNIYSVYFLLS